MSRHRELRDKVLNKIDSITSELIRIAQYIHDNPELGYQEYKAAEILTSTLSKYGFKVEKGTARIETAFRAEIQGKKHTPRIALLAEYDALPELGHACGHNLICTMSLGAAIGMSSVIDEIDGSILVIGTPAEETSGAKVPMVERGVFNDIDVAMMIHPADKTILYSSALAMDAIEFTFIGKAAHAAASPEEGINALKAAISTFTMIDMLREHLRDDVRIHGIITEGGVAPNIVPERAVARFYVRSLDRDYLNTVVEKVKNCAKGAALGIGAKVEIRNFETSFDNLITNKRLTEIFRRNLIELGITDIEEGCKKLGSTDMGNVSQVVPSIHPILQICKKGVSLHTPEFAKLTASHEAFEKMIIGAKTLALTALDVLLNSEALKEIKEEFKASTSRKEN